MLTELVNVQSTGTIFRLYFSYFSTVTLTSFMSILIGSVIKLDPELF